MYLDESIQNLARSCVIYLDVILAVTDVQILVVYKVTFQAYLSQGEKSMSKIWLTSVINGL